METLCDRERDLTFSLMPKMMMMQQGPPLRILIHPRTRTTTVQLWPWGQNLYKFLFEFTYAMAIRVVEISNGGYKIRKILPKNQHTQKKLLNFENWVNWGGVKKCQNLTFKFNFLCQKLSGCFSIFFSLKNINLGAHISLLTFFDNIDF